MTSLHSPLVLPISLFEKREELRRILESKHFASSPKKSRFLEFVSEQAFLGNGEKLNEYLIGVEVKFMIEVPSLIRKRTPLYECRRTKSGVC